jgi:Uma2 family endonuclease
MLSIAAPMEWTVADVQTQLAGFPANRIRTYPAPGTATEDDVLEAQARSNCICELIDGILVEKTMASIESALAAALIYLIQRHLESKNLGMVLAPDGLLRILPGQVRAPDVSFIRWERFPGRRPFEMAIFPVAPNLAIEILSESNTAAEMDRKLHDYFDAGVELVWYIEPRTRSALEYVAVEQWTKIAPEGILNGLHVLPGFELRLEELFARVEGPGDG